MLQGDFEFSKDNKYGYIFFLIVLMIWEIVPTYIIVYFFRVRIPYHTCRRTVSLWSTVWYQTMSILSLSLSSWNWNRVSYAEKKRPLTEGTSLRIQTDMMKMSNCFTTDMFKTGLLQQPMSQFPAWQVQSLPTTSIPTTPLQPMAPLTLPTTTPNILVLIHPITTTEAATLLSRL